MSLGDPYAPVWAVQFGGGWTALPATSATSVTITGLQPGTAYSIRVVAENTHGAAISLPVKATTLEDKSRWLYSLRWLSSAVLAIGFGSN